MSHDDPQRGTGRTLAMVKALPETGAIIVVHSAVLSVYLARMIADVRGEDVFRRMRIVVIRHHGDCRKLEFLGAALPVVFDHAWDEADIAPATWVYAYELADRQNARVAQIAGRQ
jgi:hypothetical protein